MFLRIFGSLLVVSLVSFVGIFSIGIKIEKLKKYTWYLVSLSAGALFGDVFFHMLPEISEQSWITILTSSLILSGIVFSFVIEKFVHRRHCHQPTSENHIHPFAIMNLVGDGVHNLIDGLIIASSYLISIPVWIATTFAVALHEIPQEIGDFGVLIHGGFSRRQALRVNFLTALLAVVGGILVIFLHQRVPTLTALMVPFAAGNFIYIAGSDLIPEMHKETAASKGLLQFIRFIGGVWAMLAMLVVG